ncbi:unnamed protein product [Caenorhabditis brenneri]
MPLLPNLFVDYGYPGHYFGIAFAIIGCLCMLNTALFDPKWDDEGLPLEGHSTSSSQSRSTLINILWIVFYSKCDSEESENTEDLSREFMTQNTSKRRSVEKNEKNC